MKISGDDNVQPRKNELIDYSEARYDSKQNAFVQDHKFTSIECFLDIYLNGDKLTTSFCSPGDHEDLVIGILAQMGKIRSFDDIVELNIDEDTAQVKTTEEAINFAKSAANNPRYFRVREILDCKPELIFERPKDIRFNAADILACADKLLGELAATHDVTNGVHSGVIFDGKVVDNDNKTIADKILVFREDIGRHNVFDKLYGWSLKNHVDITDKIIVFSGRCSSEMMMKLGRMGISSVAARSMPTTLSINIAKKLGITLAARMSPGSFCIYTNPQRIVL